MPSKNIYDAVRVEDCYPLSPMQQGMLFNTLADPCSGVDIEQLVCELHEVLDTVALRHAWQRLADRHPVLRTRFRWEHLDQPRQDVFASIDLPWEERDWSAVGDDVLEHLLADFLGKDRRRGFDLACAPLFRLTLLRRSKSHYLLVWTAHHAILDGQSFRLALGEVFSLYDAFLQGREPTLLLPRPYREYVEWLEQRDSAEGDAFWTEQLQGFATPTPLMIDHPPVILSDDLPLKERCEVSIPPDTTARLRSLAGSSQVTLSTIVHAAWSLVLSDYSGEREVVFGVIRAGRRAAIDGAESMIGLFVNTLPLRVRVDPDAELVSWLREVRARWLAMRPYEHTSLARIRARSEIPRDNNLFLSTVVYEERDLGATLHESGKGWATRRLKQHSQTNFHLDLAAWGGAEMRLAIDFDRSRIDGCTAGRTLSHLRILLEDMAHHPERRLGEFTLLGSEDRYRVQEDWNRTAAAHPPAACLHELFERQASRTPQAIAVQSPDGQVTFDELNRRADGLARTLRNQGLRRGVPVGIFAESSIDTIAALLAVFKAGGTYVPLNPRHPAERTAAITADARVPLVLAQPALMASMPEMPEVRIVSLEALERIGAEARDYQSGAGADDLAYIMYTSGTTGRPKGVMVPHVAVCNHLYWMQRTFPLGAGDAVLQKTALDFDVSVWEVFAPLAVGARVVLLRKGAEFDPHEIAQSIRARGVTAIQLTPVQLNLLLEEPLFQQCAPPLKHVFCGGEVLTPNSCRSFCRTLPGVTLSNMYGPTEATIDATFWNCPRDGIVDVVPIGRPIDNVVCYVVGASMQLLPPGIAGELVIGGRCLARGYLGNPQLSAEKFVPDPFSKRGSYVYKTGDRVRLLDDGNIEYLGRIDRQVKVRGLRIELEEIEGAVARHPGVRACCVAVRDDVGDRRLVAYIVPRKGAATRAHELQQFLSRSLPEYMVPGHFVTLDELPVRPSGKVDHERLPAPTRPLPIETTPLSPRTPTEVRIANIWSEILHTRDFGVRDSFIDLGANSLKLIQLISEIHMQLGVRLSIPEVVKNPSIERLARMVEGSISTPRESARVVPFRRGRHGSPVYFIFAGLPEYRIARMMGSDHPVHGIEVRWPVSWRDALATDTKSDDPRLEEVVAPYAQALHEHAGSIPCTIVGLSFAGLMAFEAAHQLKARGGEVRQVVIVDAAARPANPYKLAWTLWKRAWSERGDNQVCPASLRSRFGNSWRTTLWILAKAASRVHATVARPAPNLDVLTHIFDEDHRPLPWGLIERFYSYAHETYRPRAIDSPGVLIRTEGADGAIAHGDALGWTGLFDKGLEVVSIGGEHHSIFDHNIPNLAREISRFAARSAANDESVYGTVRESADRGRP